MLFALLIAGLLGLAFGSFLNVCIARLPAGASVIRPRSHCPLCAHPIASRDNIPVLSWIFLRGRCRHCHAHIPARYPLVELATAVWFALCVHRFATDPLTVVSMAVFGLLLVGLLVMDWRTHLLPDEFTLGGIGAGLFFAAIRSFLLPLDREARALTASERYLAHRIGAVILAALTLLLIHWLYRLLRKRDGMGLGDVKMLALIAAFLGLRQSALALFLAVIAGAGYAVYLLLTRRRQITAQTHLPFGSFLALGGLAAALFGEKIIVWYAGFYR